MEISLREMIIQEIGKEFGIETESELEQEKFVIKIDELLTKLALGKGLTLLNEEDNNNLEILLDKTDNDDNPDSQLKIVVTYLNKKKIDFFKIYREELIKMKIFIMKINYDKKSREKKEELFEMIIDNFIDSAVYYKIISPNYESISDVGKVAIGTLYNPSKKYLSKQEKRNKMKMKIIVGIIPILGTPIILFLFYLIIYILYQYNLISSMPKWAEDFPTIIKNIVHSLIH